MPRTTTTPVGVGVGVGGDEGELTRRLARPDADALPPGAAAARVVVVMMTTTTPTPLTFVRGEDGVLDADALTQDVGAAGLERPRRVVTRQGPIAARRRPADAVGRPRTIGPWRVTSTRRGRSRTSSSPLTPVRGVPGAVVVLVMTTTARAVVTPGGRGASRTWSSTPTPTPGVVVVRGILRMPLCMQPVPARI